MIEIRLEANDKYVWLKVSDKNDLMDKIKIAASCLWEELFPEEFHSVVNFPRSLGKEGEEE